MTNIFEYPLPYVLSTLYWPVTKRVSQTKVESYFIRQILWYTQNFECTGTPHHQINIKTSCFFEEK